MSYRWNSGMGDTAALPATTPMPALPAIPPCPLGQAAVTGTALNPNACGYTPGSMFLLPASALAQFAPGLLGGGLSPLITGPLLSAAVWGAAVWLLFRGKGRR